MDLLRLFTTLSNIVKHCLHVCLDSEPLDFGSGPERNLLTMLLPEEGEIFLGLGELSPAAASSTLFTLLELAVAARL